MAHLPRLVLGQVWPVTMHKAAQGHGILVWGSCAEGCLIPSENLPWQVLLGPERGVKPQT